MKNKFIYFVLGYTLFSLFSGLWLLKGQQWIGGDTMPFDFILEFIYSNMSGISTNWGLPGPTTGTSLLLWLPYAYLIKLLSIVFGSFNYSIFLGLFFFTFLMGWHKFFYNIKADHTLASLLSFLMLFNPLSWLVLNRNVLFLIVLFTFLPWLLLSVKKIFEIGDKKSWLQFMLVVIFISTGLLNTGFALPAILLSAVYFFIFVDWIPNYKRIFGIIFILILFTLPNILGQLNLYNNSKALQDDYWNNIVLTKIPLDRHKVSNIFTNVIAGYNWDTLANYGYDQNNEDYKPWWFASYKNTSLSILLYIPIFVALILTILTFIKLGWHFKKENSYLAVLSLFMIFCIFMMKSSSGFGGQWFYDYMMESGWFKMFRSPHLKFGVEYYASIAIIITYCLNILRNKNIINITKILLSIYLSIFCVYTIISGKYIPVMQKVNSIPSEYFEVRNIIKMNNKDWNLGILLPANDSTWDSNNWGYEGYHILHWLETGVSFLNRNGLSFNKDNLIGFYAWMKMGNNGEYDPRSIDVLREQGYDIIIYDASSDRMSRFRKEEHHERNLNWLDSQGDRLIKLQQINFITIYEIRKDYEMDKSWVMDIYKQKIIQILK